MVTEGLKPFAVSPCRDEANHLAYSPTGDFRVGFMHPLNKSFSEWRVQPHVAEPFLRQSISLRCVEHPRARRVVRDGAGVKVNAAHGHACGLNYFCRCVPLNCSGLSRVTRRLLKVPPRVTEHLYPHRSMRYLWGASCFPPGRRARVSMQGWGSK